MRMDPRLIRVISGPPKRVWTMKPPTNAPAIPIKIVIMIPPGSGPGMTHLASTPATSPTTINATMPMRFHLPLVHHSLPSDDTRKRNITDAVPHATIARFTPHSARINSLRSAGPAAGEFDQDVGDEPEAYAVGDVEGQRQGENGQECRDGLVETVPRDEPHGGHHQEPDHYEGGGGHRRNEQGVVTSCRIGYRERAAEDGDQGRERQGEQAEEPDDHAGHAGSSSFGDPRPALYIARYRARAHASAEDGGQRVDQQDALGLRHLAFLGHGEHRPHGVEEVCHEQGEDHGQQRELQDLPYSEHPAPDGRGVELEVYY